MAIIAKLKALLEKGHARSVVARKNILLSMAYKFIGMAIGFAYYPISIDYLSSAQFGIFITLETFIDWFAFMDIGIGKGLRNMIGGAFANDEKELARSYVSTAYFIIGAIFAGLIILFIGISFFVDWSSVLNTDPKMRKDLTYLVIIVFVAFSLRFVSSMVYEVFNAFQQTSKVDLFNMVGKVVFLLAILLLISFVAPSLLYFGIARSFAFASVPIVVAIYFFRTKFRDLAPSFKYFDIKHAKSLTTLGIKFFFIQIALLVINETNYYLILKLIDPEAVTPYATAFKYYSIVVFGFSVAANPLWAAYIEAYEKRDFEWVRRTIKKMLKVWTVALGVMMVMVAVSPWVFELWVGEEIESQIPYSLSILIAMMIMIANWNSVFNLFINGTGKIRLQMWATFGIGLINIPLCILLAKGFDMGTNGVVLGSVISLLLMAILSPIQVSKILNGTDKGIWGK
ncbi:MAG: lipopolysaccharide biosynthesis protein [Bacteroidia bacterium]